MTQATARQSPTTSEGDIADAIAATRATFESRRTSPLSWRRAQLRGLERMLTEHADRVHDALLSDLGKNATEAHLTEVTAVVQEARLLRRKLRRWTKERRRRTSPLIGTSRASIQRQPLGPVLIIGPWNYPINLVLVPLAGAIAAGNTAVLKPSELAPASSRLLAELVPQYLDPTAVRVVEGGVDETTRLLEEPWGRILYTGNSKVGSIVMEAAAKHLTPVTLELGGKSPLWIDDSVSIKSAARSIAWGKFTNCGQTCVAPDYVLTTRRVAGELARELTAAIEEFYGAEPRLSPDYGRIVNERHAERLAGLLGAGELVTGGDVDIDSRYVAPTVLVGVSREDAIMQEEIFGPILPIVVVDDLDAAIDVINERPHPLALYAYTRRRRVKKALSARTQSGGLTFNTAVAQLSVPHLPFGGVGNSGMGAYRGEQSIRTFSHERSVLHKTRGVDSTRAVHPPHSRWKERVVTKASTRMLP
ncbi:aldehyde dehydrogenase family protein [Demequina globuliformis]|uniref:aldehyde dehydrogenase family protein n=1 Tax=Demequina globuliformis TaxID=676202 RepID=UPI0007828D75|nr:aldehyde dehydrogenase family protein [Demequina globuliformis]